MRSDPPSRIDDWAFVGRVAALGLFLLVISAGARAQNNAAKKSLPKRAEKSGAFSPRVSLTPRFIPGQTFRYEMEFETTTETTRSGMATER